MRIVITGATGFLGRHLLPLLRDHELVCLTRSAPREMERTDNTTWIVTDLSHPLDVSKLPNKADAILHLAQSPKYRDFPGGAEDMLRVNVDAPAALLNWARRAGVSRAVLASTGSIYEPFDGPMREDSAVYPTTYYPASKYACEVLSRAYRSDMAICQLRLFFLYGPGQDGMLVANLIDAVRGGKTLTIQSDGEGLVFVPTFVSDAANVVKRSCENSWDGVYNVASPHEVSFRELLTEIGKAVGRDPLIDVTGDTPPQPIVPDLGKLREMVDIEAFLPISRGIPRTAKG